MEKSKYDRLMKSKRFRDAIAREMVKAWIGEGFAGMINRTSMNASTAEKPFLYCDYDLKDATLEMLHEIAEDRGHELRISFVQKGAL